jgi:hypothetical protein
MVLFVVSLLVLQPYAMAQADAPGAEAIGRLHEKVNSSVSLNASWPAVEALLDQQMRAIVARNDYKPAIRYLSSNHPYSELKDTTQIFAFVRSLQERAISISTSALEASGLPPALAAAMSERMPRPYLFKLQRALLAYAQTSSVQTDPRLRSALAGVLRQSSNTLLANKQPKAGDFSAVADSISRKLSPAPSANSRASAYFVLASVSEHHLISTQNSTQGVTKPPDFIALGIDKDVLPYLNNDAKQLYANLADASKKEQFVEGVAEDFIQRAQHTGQSVASKVLTAENSVNAIITVAQFQQVQRTSAEGIEQGARQFHDGLDAATQYLSKQWDDNIAAASIAANSTTSGLTDAAAKIANTTHLVGDLRSLTSGGNLSADAIGELGAIALQGAPQSVQRSISQLATGIQQLTSSQGSLFGEGQALLGTLSSITGSPAIAQVQSVFSTVAPFLQAAGPLLGLASMATPLGGLALVGGLFGGSGGGDAGQLAAIQQTLSEINHKLDMVLSKLDALDQKITRDHIEEMNALESISFDVNRTRDLIASTYAQNYRKKCEDLGQVTGSSELTVTDKKNMFAACNSNLNDLFSGNEAEPVLNAVNSLETYGVSQDQTALSKYRSLLKVYEKSKEVATQSCLDLSMASSSVHDLESLPRFGLSEALPGQQQGLCNRILSIEKLLDSGLLAYFVNLEWELSTQSGVVNQTVVYSAVWGSDEAGQMAFRWQKELFFTNVAIGQQSRLTGDVTTPLWANKLELKNPLEVDEADTLDQSEILAENAVRYWTQIHLRQTYFADSGRSGAEDFEAIARPVQYAAASQACSPVLLETLLQKGTNGDTDFGSTKLLWTANVVDGSKNLGSPPIDRGNLIAPCATDPNKATAERWCATFTGLKNCIVLPTPEHVITGELRRSDDVEGLLAARQRLLTLIETRKLLSDLSGNLRDTLIDALIMQWIVEQKALEGNRAEPQTARLRRHRGASPNSDGIFSEMNHGAYLKAVGN